MGIAPCTAPHVESSSLGNNDAKTRAGCEAQARRAQGKVCRCPQAPPPSTSWGCQEEGGVHLGGKPPSQPAAMVTLSLQRCLQLGTAQEANLPSRCAHQCQRPPSSRQSQPASWRRAAGGARGPLQPLGLLVGAWNSASHSLALGSAGHLLPPGRAWKPRSPASQLPFSAPFSIRAGQDRQSALARFESLGSF